MFFSLNPPKRSPLNHCSLLFSVPTNSLFSSNRHTRSKETYCSFFFLQHRITPQFLILRQPSHRTHSSSHPTITSTHQPPISGLRRASSCCCASDWGFPSEPPRLSPPGTSSITTAAPPLNGLLLRLFLSRITQHLSPKLPSPASQRCRRRRATTSSVFKPTVVRCDCRSRSTPESYRHSATSEPLASAAISDEGFTLRSRKSS